MSKRPCGLRSAAAAAAAAAIKPRWRRRQRRKRRRIIVFHAQLPPPPPPNPKARAKHKEREDGLPRRRRSPECLRRAKASHYHGRKEGQKDGEMPGALIGRQKFLLKPPRQLPNVKIRNADKNWREENCDTREQDAPRPPRVRRSSSCHAKINPGQTRQLKLSDGVSAERMRTT